MTRRTPASVATPRRARFAGALATIVVAQLLLVAPVAAGPTPDRDAPIPVAALPSTVLQVGPDTSGVVASPPSDGPVVPTVHYEEAVAHLDDRIEFEPGGRVDVPFKPRATDRHAVGGRAPRPLPAGRATGAQMAAAAQGSVWASEKVRAGGDAQIAPPSVAGTAEPSPGPSAEPSAEASVAPSPASSSEPSVEPSAPVDAPAVDPADVQAAVNTVASEPLVEAASDPAAAGLQREVFGFLPYWELSDSTTTLDYDLLSTIAYFSVGADKSGNLLKRNRDGSTTTGWGGWTSSKLTNVINAAHSKGTRVVLTITVFAWTAGGRETQAALLGSSSARLNLARQTAAAVRDRGADGVNLDFEPIVSGYDDEFVALLRTVRAELDKVAPGYQLTFDTGGFIGNYPIEEGVAPGAADAIFIMGYDYRTAGSSPVGSIDPLTGPAYDLTDTLKAYTARVPGSKLILGVPYYGRAWSTDTDQPRAKNISGTKYGTSNTVVYTSILPYASQYGRRWDGVEQSPWVVYRRENCTTTYGCVTAWRQIWYDDAESLRLRYDLVNRYGLRGAGIWALGYDGTRPELYQALADKFQHDTTAPLAGIRALSPSQSSEDFTVSWTGTDDRGIASWDVQVSVDGGAWQDWLTATSATNATYTGADGHGFAFRVRARDGAGNTSPWDVTHTSASSTKFAPGGFGEVVTDNLNVRSSAGTSASIVTKVHTGTTVAVKSGPVAKDGYNWYQVDVPIKEWSPVSGLHSGVWIAASGGGTSFVRAAAPPNSTRVALGSEATAADGARFRPMTPTRLLDTRAGNGLSGAFGSGTPRSFQITGRGGIPAGAVAVTGNLTITGATGSGYVTLGPSVSATPTTSTLNAPRGDTRAAGVTVALSGDGRLSAVFKSGSGTRAHLVFDVTGYFVKSTGAGYVPLTPARIVDSRKGLGVSSAIGHRSPRTFTVAGRGGVPSGAVAVTGNLTITGQTSSGYVSLGPVSTSRPVTSTLNLPYRDTRANGVTVALTSTGTLSAVWVGTSGSRAHVVFDVTGYFVSSPAGATFHSIAPVRLLDTRAKNGLPGALATGTPKLFVVAGRGTIPPGSVAVTGTLTITGQTHAGHLTLGTELTSAPQTSTLNAPKGDTRANGVSVKLRGNDLAIVYTAASGAKTHAVFDATGYFR